VSVSRLRNDREPLNQIADPRASEATATGNAASSVERLAPSPTHDEVARRAYQLFEERGREPGREWEDWFRAEREL
jgi:Protein of unknown function (DUF2934)